MKTAGINNLTGMMQRPKNLSLRNLRNSKQKILEVNLWTTPYALKEWEMFRK